MPVRSWLAVLAGLAACAPSVPRSARNPPPPDAGSGADLAVTGSEPPADARGESRPPAADARADTAGEARGDTPGDARVDTAIDTRGDAGLIDARGDAAADGRGDTIPGADSSNADADADGGDAGADGPGAVVPGPGDLVIDEILINPAGTDTNREWIEIVNESAFTLDLGSLHVADAASDVGVEAGLLAPGARLVLGQSLDPTRNRNRDIWPESVLAKGSRSA